MKVNTNPRKERAKQILKDIHLYKVCYGCDSILKSEAAVCPVCKNYRFETDPIEVQKSVIELSNKEQTITIDYT